MTDNGAFAKLAETRFLRLSVILFSSEEPRFCQEIGGWPCLRGIPFSFDTGYAKEWVPATMLVDSR
jgi:hypothetical protein